MPKRQEGLTQNEQVDNEIRAAILAIREATEYRILHVLGKQDQVVFSIGQESELARKADFGIGSLYQELGTRASAARKLGFSVPVEDIQIPGLTEDES